MSEIFVVSDTHFGHHNILEFEPELFGHFSNVDERDDYLVKLWNETVKPNDRVWHLGDIAFNTRLPILERLNGNLDLLLMGNHEHKNISLYSPYFKDIKAYHSYQDIIFSHIPVHPSQFKRWKFNVHGHTHLTLLDDPRYINVCIEQTGLKPISLGEILNKCNQQGGGPMTHDNRSGENA